MKFLDELEKVLSSDKRFIGEDNQIIKTKVSDAARSNDGELLKALFKNKLLKEVFFTKVDDIYVFDKNKFVWVLESKEFLPDSYTMYKNKIGLVDAINNMISKQQDVSLVWPYKDCVLEGGQTKEDQKRDEIFYNETLAPDQVNRLLALKVLGNAKRYTKDGVEEDIEFNEHDNLIIKGNNLLALSSLLERYEGQVKCIYIDPPYNTSTDSFGYNDNFNRSTWLTFMKNRLKLARKLLSEDGAIYVQLDYHQAHYCKVLMDEVFGEDNFEREIIWRIGWISGYKSVDNNWIRNHDTILFYSKDNKRLRFIKNYILKNEFKEIAKSEAERYPIEDVWNGNEYDNLNSIAITSFSGETVSKMLEKSDEVKGQKSEKLIERIFKAHTTKGDLVMDFFLGSGTTAAVAHKMGLRYIGIEQLDKHIDISLRRLNKVLLGEQSGISKKHDWKGGGSFIYCELLEDNENLVNELEDAKDSKAVKEILNKAIDNGKLIPSILPSDLKNTEEEFNNLSLDEQKNLVMELLNKNKLYVNLSDMDDEDYDVNEADKKFTRSFYNKE
ncbi:DNA methyltransferase [Mediannikoviicoccus vaginalis]|uniref:DNA methyltransferase n=1 Tax=Mediannikoviicoccus vaginalis TaxID=2899727 RepID=UPI001F286FBF|nr:site-specific DNA-methyltransferase [Mediannikoviicoccus vaginalis]